MKIERRFGPYLIEVIGNHATIWREDLKPVEPTFYEMQYMKDLAFGGCATAVEVFPSHRNLVDGAHQRHLWEVDEKQVPNLHTGEGVNHKGDKQVNKNEVEMFSREELQKIKKRAYEFANIEGIDSAWKRVLLRLGDAANELDAFMARCEEKVEPKLEKEKSSKRR